MNTCKTCIHNYKVIESQRFGICQIKYQPYPLKLFVSDNDSCADWANDAEKYQYNQDYKQALKDLR